MPCCASTPTVGTPRVDPQSNAPCLKGILDPCSVVWARMFTWFSVNVLIDLPGSRLPVATACSGPRPDVPASACEAILSWS